MQKKCSGMDDVKTKTPERVHTWGYRIVEVVVQSPWFYCTGDNGLLAKSL